MREQRVTYQDVLGMVRTFAEKATSGVTVPMVTSALGDKLDIRTQPDTWSGYRSAAGDRLQGQVRRALEALTASGDLVKTVEELYGRQKTAVYRTAAVTARLAQQKEDARKAQEARQAEEAEATWRELAQWLREFRGLDSADMAAGLMRQFRIERREERS